MLDQSIVETATNSLIELLENPFDILNEKFIERMGYETYDRQVQQEREKMLQYFTQLTQCQDPEIIESLVSLVSPYRPIEDMSLHNVELMEHILKGLINFDNRKKIEGVIATRKEYALLFHAVKNIIRMLQDNDVLVTELVDTALNEVHRRSGGAKIIMDAAEDIAENIALYLCVSSLFFVDVLTVSEENLVAKLRNSLVITLDLFLHPDKKEIYKQEIETMIR